ncbi:MAG: sulfite exporter TauE/SafE family protein [Verrucomicrobia bacterium]|nr:sulfite exporter TauE/SafE family protein [Verrucomicrobiota bacterium]
MDFNALLQQGAAHAWLYLPVAVLLGALHGLEPGHSKTMMAAFIIAVRGTVLQAALLGLSAALSHSVVIWALAAFALKFGSQWNVETTEPYFQIGTGVIVIAMAAWTLWRLRRGADHHHHHHHDEAKALAGTEGTTTLSIHEDGVPPRFRLVTTAPATEPVLLRTTRADGSTQEFHFTRQADGWESNETIPEPHAFRAEIVLRGRTGAITAVAEFTEHTHDDEPDDAHARAHAEEIERRFTGRAVTTPQIILFGLTGGLMPCPAALSILLVCLQLKKFTLGFSLVAAFSVGLALTLVTVGVVAAWGLRHVTQRSGTLSRLAHKAPALSSFLLIALGTAFLLRGLWHFV